MDFYKSYMSLYFTNVSLYSPSLHHFISHYDIYLYTIEISMHRTGDMCDFELLSSFYQPIFIVIITLTWSNQTKGNHSSCIIIITPIIIMSLIEEESMLLIGNMSRKVNKINMSKHVNDLFPRTIFGLIICCCALTLKNTTSKEKCA